jgi:hypothetical protein
LMPDQHPVRLELEPDIAHLVAVTPEVVHGRILGGGSSVQRGARAGLANEQLEGCKT